MRLRPNLPALLAVLVAVLGSADAMAMLHPRMGRFMQRDPLGTELAGYRSPLTLHVNSTGLDNLAALFKKDVSRPNLQYQDGMNLYQYIRSNPIDETDAYGLCAGNRCGPDITKDLRRLAIILSHRFRTMPKNQKRTVCRNMYSAGGWDITVLAAGVAREPECPGIDCPGTVTVEGVCYNQRTVNYFLWGNANRLCGCTVQQALRTVAIWKQWQYGHLGWAAQWWTQRGYGHRPGNKDIIRPGHKGSHPECEACSTEYSGSLHGNVGGLAF